MRNALNCLALVLMTVYQPSFASGSYSEVGQDGTDHMQEPLFKEDEEISKESITLENFTLVANSADTLTRFKQFGDAIESFTETVHSQANKSGTPVSIPIFLNLVRVHPVLKNGQEYILEIKTDKISITSLQLKGLLYGFTSLERLIIANQGALKIKRYRDWPDFPGRALHFGMKNVRPAHKAAFMEETRRIIQRARLSRLTTLIFQFDAKEIVLETIKKYVPRAPSTCSPSGEIPQCLCDLNPTYTKDDVSQIIKCIPHTLPPSTQHFCKRKTEPIWPFLQLIY